MEYFWIEGMHRLSGTIRPMGNKNAALPLLAASLLTDDALHLRNVPNIGDVRTKMELLTRLGVAIQPDEAGGCALQARAVADNQPAALSLGVHVRRVFALSWAIAALVCAMSGIVLGILNGISVHDLSAIGLKVFPVVILGGLDSIGGAILGGLIIGLLETFTGGYVSTSLREIIPYIVLVFILMVRPYGLFGLVEIERV